MTFARALDCMMLGGWGMQRAGWAEYWCIHKGQVRAYMLDGSCYPLERMYSIRYILESAAAEDWVVVPMGTSNN